MSTIFRKRQVKLKINNNTMKKILLLLLIVTVTQIFSQTVDINTLKQSLKTAKEDTNKVNNYLLLSKMLYKTSVYEASLENANNAKALAEKLEYKSGIASSLSSISMVYFYQGKYPESIKIQNDSIKIRE